jgi:signal transduction histidine kinase
VSSDSTIILTAIFSVTIVALGLLSFFILMMVRNHRKIEAAQREKIHQMQLFSEKLQLTREEEQKQIARELHDELGGVLTSLKYDLLWLEKNTAAKGPIKKRYKVLRELIDSTTKTVQRISSELRPKILDSVGLVAAIEWHTREFTKRTGIQVQLKQNAELPRIEDIIATGVYRIVQEALTNVARHSQASHVNIGIVLNDGTLCVEISDNGKGLDNAALANPESLGILGMQERARMINGEITITGYPGKGTNISLLTPLACRNKSL